MAARKETLDELEFDAKEIGNARLSLRDAKQRLLEAQKHLDDSTNRFVREGDGYERFINASLDAIPNPIPRDGTFQTYDGAKNKWSNLAAHMVNEVAEIAAETDGWAPLWSFSGFEVEQSAARSMGDEPSYFRVSATLPVAPELLLLTQTRCSAQGILDPALVVMQEHHVFSDGHTAIRHSVRDVGPAALVRKRDFVDMTTWTEREDGTLVFASKSVPNALPANVVDKWYQLSSITRGDKCVFGLVMTPCEVKGSVFSRLLGGKSKTIGTKVTLVSQINWSGNIPLAWVNMQNKAGMVDYLKRAQQQVKEWEKQGVSNDLIEKFLPELVPAPPAEE